uniref:Zinc finger protein RFP-like n=1 Tax=Pelusios castaneus TaxID=367368 RepID=A0A8C8S438_9SAUR
MAAADLEKTLQDETICPICQEYFKDPVLLDCDHNFCRACIMHYWEGSQTVSCPQCRQTCSLTNLRPNKLLRTIVEAVWALRLQSLREAETERLCEKHREALKLFCKEDEIPICVMCDRSKEHRNHTVIPAEVAASDFKEKIQAHLKTLREEKKNLLKCKRQKIVSEFQQLRQFLEEQERLLLAQLEKLDRENVKLNENVTKISVEIAHLSELISEVEGKCQKPTNEFLQVRLMKYNHVKLFLSRCEKGKFEQPEEISPELEKGLSDFSQKTVALVETVKTFKGLSSAPNTLILPPVTLTLDPDTAHPFLVLSEDGKCNLPNNPERFDTERCVLGRAGFTSGRHCWEVEVGGGEGWSVGVARESVPRKGEISLSPEEQIWAVGVARESVGRKGGISLSPEGGIWAVGRWGDQFRALTSPATPLPQSRAPSRIRVCLDCDRGQVTFFGAGDEAPIFTFPPGSVPGERIRPWLWVGGIDTRLQLCP